MARTKMTAQTLGMRPEVRPGRKEVGMGFFLYRHSDVNITYICLNVLGYIFIYLDIIYIYT